MKLKDSGKPQLNSQMGAVVIVTVLVVLLILGIVLIPNINKTKDPSDKVFDYLAEAGEKFVYGDGTPIIDEPPQTGSGVNSPSDLDFWELYPEKKDEPQVDGSEQSSSGKEEEPEEEDPSKDGKHTLVVNRNGEEEWVLISQYLPKHDYDYTNLVSKNDRLEYYIDGKKSSYIGIDISKYQDYIDFVKVAKDGIDFVMIRVGSRGYGTGQITLDDYFFDNIKRATDAGLHVGVYFSSQAITAEEAAEEAQIVIDSLGEYRIDYPICFDMEFVRNDTARVEILSKADRTTVAKAFLDKVRENGYTGMIYGDKEWLIKEVDMSKLTDFDVWFSQEKDLPDYPYKFSMWQYKKNGTVDGVSGFVDLNISFVDYTEK